MKQKSFYCVLFLLSFFIFNNCSDDDSQDPAPTQGQLTPEPGIAEADVETYGGDLGLLINTRALIKKGYKPNKVTVSTNATQANHNQTIVVNPLTGLAKLSVSIDSVTKSVADELINGVSLDIDVLDEAGKKITTYSNSIIPFKENGTQINIEATALEYVSQALDFNPDSKHYLQLVKPNGDYNGDVVWKPSSALDKSVSLERRNSSFSAGTTSEQYFLYKMKNAENEFAIYSANTKRYIEIGNSSRILKQSGVHSYPTSSPESLGKDFIFIIKREPNGLFTISGKADGNQLKGGTTWSTKIKTSSPPQYFRIINLDVNWEATELGTTHDQPIYPPAKTSFGFNSSLVNCGAGSLDQNVGIEKEVTTTFTNALSESIGLSSRVTTSVDVSVSATAEASFFGNGGSVTGEVSAGLEVSVEASKTTTVSSEKSVSKTNKFFSNRIVNVPAGKASLVYDAYQTYSNVRVPYVKTIRLKGKPTAGAGALSGLKIATQLSLTGFTGTITKVESDYVEVAIRGNMYLDNIVDTITEVKDIPSNCN